MKTSVPFVSLETGAGGLLHELLPAAERVIRRGNFILGGELEAFESAFAAYCGAGGCAGVASGLDALTLSLRAWDIGPGDEVITPAHTFFATWLAISQAGAKPVAADIDPSSYTLDPGSLRSRISSRTKAVIAVHLYGQPCGMDEIRSIAAAAGIKVLEDAAQAHGATYGNARAGTLGDAAAFSFYPTKNLGALGDAGAVVTDDPSFLKRLKRLRNYGSDSKYVFDELGVNSRLDELHAALLSCKLAHLDRWNEERQAIAARYMNGMAGCSVALPTVHPGRSHVWHLFVVRTPAREAFMAHLAARGISAQIHYPRLPHEQLAYAAAGCDANEFPESLRAAREVVSLPLWPGMTADQIESVITAVKDFDGR